MWKIYFKFIKLRCHLLPNNGSVAVFCEFIRQTQVFSHWYRVWDFLNRKRNKAHRMESRSGRISVRYHPAARRTVVLSLCGRAAVPFFPKARPNIQGCEVTNELAQISKFRVRVMALSRMSKWKSIYFSQFLWIFGL